MFCKGFFCNAFSKVCFSIKVNTHAYNSRNFHKRVLISKQARMSGMSAGTSAGTVMLELEIHSSTNIVSSVVFCNYLITLDDLYCPYEKHTKLFSPFPVRSLARQWQMVHFNRTM